MSIPPGTDTEKIIHRGVPLLNGIAHCDMGGGGGGSPAVMFFYNVIAKD